MERPKLSVDTPHSPALSGHYQQPNMDGRERWGVIPGFPGSDTNRSAKMYCQGHHKPQWIIFNPLPRTLCGA